MDIWNNKVASLLKENVVLLLTMLYMYVTLLMTQYNMLKTFEKFGYYYSVGEVMLNFIQNLWNLVKSSIISDMDQYKVILIIVICIHCVSHLFLWVYKLKNNIAKWLKYIKKTINL